MPSTCRCCWCDPWYYSSHTSACCGTLLLGAHAACRGCRRGAQVSLYFVCVFVVCLLVCLFLLDVTGLTGECFPVDCYAVGCYSFECYPVLCCSGECYPVPDCEDGSLSLSLSLEMVPDLCGIFSYQMQFFPTSPRAYDPSRLALRNLC